MAVSSPKHGLTRTSRGWIRRVNGKPKWICGHRAAPTAAAADDFYEKNFTTLWQPAPQTEATDDPQDAATRDLLNVFLTRKRSRIGQVRRGIAQGTFDEYEAALDDFCRHRPGEDSRCIGDVPYRELGPAHFGSFDVWLAGRYGIDRQKKAIIAVRSAFKMLAQPPIRLPLPDYGDQFQLPTKKDVRLARARHRYEHGPKFFEPAEAKALIVGRWRSGDELEAERLRRADGPHRGLSTRIRRRIRGAGPALRAMVLLGLNAGFGNTDLGELPLSVARRALRSEWIDYARGKTGAARLAWLWPETRHAVERYLRVRPEPVTEAAAELLFVTEYGYPYVTDDKDQIAIRCGALLRRLGLLRRGRNFYSLRRTYRSLAAEVGKELVIDLSMGHADDGDDMAKVYTVTELRVELKLVASHVRSVVLDAPLLDLTASESAERRGARPPVSSQPKRRAAG